MPTSEIERINSSEINTAKDLQDVIESLCEGYFREPNDILVRIEESEYVFLIEVPNYYIDI